MRRAAKVDGNQGAIVAALVKAGASIVSLAQLGHGIPDLLVCFRRTLYLMEIKDGELVPSRRQLTPDQIKWISLWPGPVCIVTSVDEALRAIGAIE